MWLTSGIFPHFLSIFFSSFLFFYSPVVSMSWEEMRTIWPPPKCRCLSLCISLSLSLSFSPIFLLFFLSLMLLLKPVVNNVSKRQRREEGKRKGGWCATDSQPPSIFCVSLTTAMRVFCRREQHFPNQIRVQTRQSSM